MELERKVKQRTLKRLLKPKNKAEIDYKSENEEKKNSKVVNEEMEQLNSEISPKSPQNLKRNPVYFLDDLENESSIQTSVIPSDKDMTEEFIFNQDKDEQLSLNIKKKNLSEKKEKSCLGKFYNK